jgi:hypothetical protein
MWPINVKKMDDIKQAMEHNDHDHQDFWTAIEAWRTSSKEDRDE